MPAAVGDILPRVQLRRSDGAGTVGWRDVRHVTVAVFPHPDCRECGTYLGRLDREERLSTWGGRVLAILDVPSEPGAVSGLGGVVAVADPHGEARRSAGVATDTVTVLVIDRFGQVFAHWTDEDLHDLPTPEAILREVRFISIQCPECEVPDTPPGL